MKKFLQKIDRKWLKEERTTEAQRTLVGFDFSRKSMVGKPMAGLYTKNRAGARGAKVIQGDETVKKMLRKKGKKQVGRVLDIDSKNFSAMELRKAHFQVLERLFLQYNDTPQIIGIPFWPNTASLYLLIFYLKPSHLSEFL